MQPVAPSKQTILEAVTRALQEDVGSGDVTATLIPAAARATATVISREAATLCGSAWFDCVFEQLDPSIQVQWQAADGERIAENQVLCTLQGPARPILTGERTALNFLQTLSGTATAAARYAEAVRGTAARVLDTRKTLPGLREAQKYAVVCGGCSNHRKGLYDGILIKENHIMAAGGIKAAVAAARRQSSLAVEVEVENLAQVGEALEAGADILLLDNFFLSDLAAAVQANAGRARLEASGGITLQNIAAVAATGVDYISIGAMTKDVKAVDLSMRFQLR